MTRKAKILQLSTKQALGIALTTAVGIEGCSKYEDNPPISLRSKEARLVGDWEMENPDDFFMYEDYSGYYGDMIKFTDVAWSFEEEGDFEMKIDLSISYTGYYGTVSETYSETFDGEWEWKNDKEEIELDMEEMDERFDYKILRLTKKELVVEFEGEEFEFIKD